MPHVLCDVLAAQPADTQGRLTRLRGSQLWVHLAHLQNGEAPAPHQAQQSALLEPSTSTGKGRDTKKTEENKTVSSLAVHRGWRVLVCPLWLPGDSRWTVGSSGTKHVRMVVSSFQGTKRPGRMGCSRLQGSRTRAHNTHLHGPLCPGSQAGSSYYS